MWQLYFQLSVFELEQNDWEFWLKNIDTLNISTVLIGYHVRFVNVVILVFPYIILTTKMSLYNEIQILFQEENQFYYFWQTIKCLTLFCDKRTRQEELINYRNTILSVHLFAEE
jgi:hypothetical protein